MKKIKYYYNNSKRFFSNLVIKDNEIILKETLLKLSEKHLKLENRLKNQCNFILRNIKVAKDFKSLKEYQFYLEASIDKKYSDWNHSFQEKEKRLKDCLELKLGKDVGLLLFKATINCLYYQAVNFENRSKNVQGVWIILKPLISFLWDRLNKNLDFSNKYFDCKLKKLKLQMYDIEIEKQELKKEHKKSKSLYYKETLSRLNKELLVLKKEEKILLQKDLSKILNEYFDILIGQGIKMETKKLKQGYKKARYLLFENWEFGNTLQTYYNLSEKPMVCEPNDWIASSDKQSVSCGGFLINKEEGSIELYTPTTELINKIIWNNLYLDSINQIQKFAIYFDLSLVNDVFKIGLEDLINFSEDLKLSELEYEEILEKWKNKITNSLNLDEAGIKSIRLEKIMKDKIVASKRGSLIKKIQDLIFLLVFKKSFSFQGQDIAKVYFPIMLDVSLRMYNKGIMNIYDNKLLRHLVTFKSSHHFNSNISKKNTRFVLESILTKNGISKEKTFVNEIFKNPELKTIKSKLLEIKINKEKFKLVWLDATASAIQIYSMLFGCINLANWTNLGSTEEYIDVYTRITEGIPLDPLLKDELWNDEMIKTLQNRKVVKGELQFYLYGSLPFSSINRITNLTSLSNQEALIVTNFLRNYFNSILQDAFEWKKIFLDYIDYKGKDFKGFTWTLQKNFCEYTYHKIISQNMRIKTKSLGTNNKFKVYKKSENIYVAKTKNTLLTTLFHSRDAFINVRFSLEFKKRYGYEISRIHDSFSIPIHLVEEACRLYKEILYEDIFSSELGDILELPLDAPENLKKRYLDLINSIADKKKLQKWTLYKKYEYSKCLYPD